MPTSSRHTKPAAATVTLYRDGPYVVRGPVRILDEDGREIDAGRGTVALCRCGRTRTGPFCDGTHARTGFTAPGTGRRRVGRPGPEAAAPGSRSAAAGAPDT